MVRREEKAAVFQVWHDHHWPESYLSHVLGGCPEPPFPQSYTHVANVRADSLAQAVELTTDKGHFLDPELWQKNPEVEVLVLAPRETTIGDVIVDPQGQAHRVVQQGFREIAVRYDSVRESETVPQTRGAATAGTKRLATQRTGGTRVSTEDDASRPASEETAREHTNALGESIRNRLVSFGESLQHVARAADQRDFAEQFHVAVRDFAKGEPVNAADLEPLGDWLKEQGERFEALARTQQQKELAASLREFINEITSPAVYDAFQRPLVNELVNDIKMAMTEGSSNDVPFAQMSKEGKEEFLSFAIDWTDYINRGLSVGIKGEETYKGIDRIIQNAIAGRPSEQWMEPPKPAGERYEEMLNRHAGKATKATEREADRGRET